MAGEAAAASNEFLGLHHNPLTLTRWILSQQKHFPEAQGDFSLLLQSIQLACKVRAPARPLVTRRRRRVRSRAPRARRR
jgi:hypothetical protein